jgi:selenocysteine lyase/cysteine desulfurase
VTELETYLASFDAEPGYLDWAAFGPISQSVRTEAQADAELLGTGRRSSIDLVSDRESETRELVADLLDVDVEGVTLQPSATQGLMQAAFGLAGGLLVGRAEFPSLTVSARRAADALGSMQVHWLEPDDGMVTPDAVADELTDDDSALAVSLVDYHTGYRADLTALRDVIGDRLLIVDAVQGFGVVDADYAAADVVCGHGFKWLRAGRGTGFAWFGPRAQERLTPVFSGRSGVDPDAAGDDVPGVARSAQAFTVSPSDQLAAARLGAALRDVRDVGVDRIEPVIEERTAQIISFADRFDVPVITPRTTGERAGIVSLAPSAQDAAPLAAALANHGLTFTARGGVVRLSPHAGTGDDTLQILGDALAAFSSARVW